MRPVSKPWIQNIAVFDFAKSKKDNEGVETYVPTEKKVKEWLNRCKKARKHRNTMEDLGDS